MNSSTSQKILVADYDEHVRSFLRRILENAGHSVFEASDGVDAVTKMNDEIQIVVIDNAMPRITGLECISHIRSKVPTAEVIMLSVGGVSDAVAAMRAGAFWYLQKPVNPEELLVLLEKAREHIRLRDEGAQFFQAIGESPLGFDPAKSLLLPRDIGGLLPRIAALDCSVLITGETGTGKSTLARCIHQKGARYKNPFIGISCAALPHDLLEAELFGYERGAFTGAVKARPGRVELADTGTLFLDEIGDMALDLQPKLLTFLEDRVVHRIGSTVPKRIDIRLIAATLQDLDQMCSDRRFRQDLYFRLKVVCLHLLPLRNRVDDLPSLVRAIIRRNADRYNYTDLGIEDSALARMQAYNWPGNIRELENCIERAMLLGGSGRITNEFLLLGSGTEHSVAHPTRTALGGIPLAQIEQEAIQQTIQLCRGNKREAARKLGISEKSIYNKMQRFERERLHKDASA
jgi:DNA-binding NtrC family response regulator